MDEPTLPLPRVDRATDSRGTEPGGPPDALLWPGRVLGKRYRAERMLGRGGMGEVWLAYDLKVCVEVALKALSPFPGSSRVPDLLRKEVRAAREVVSPNVCRIYDLIEVEGHELLSMEYVDGISIREFQARNAPVEIQRANEIATQLLAGLQAIHDAGLIHRDLKPENIMVTPSGRVVVMDFGIAKSMIESSHGTVAGTPAYMAPEQARGQPVDARADIYAAGTVLIELIHPEPLRSASDQAALWQGIHAQPPLISASPWRDALARAVASAPADRHPTALAFSQTLAELTLQVAIKDDRCPYPGLSSFTEADAGFFFGRESDVEALAKKLQRLHMLAVVGPSGVGKSSFLRAGLIPAVPRDWACVYCTPGPSPFVALGQALAPQLAGDTEAVRALVRFAEPDVAVSAFARWRQGRGPAVLVMDQFEELFTQNPPEVQRSFAEFLGRLPLEADVRVVLSLRDDFLFHCHAYPGLRPILTELTLLAPLRGLDLRRALVQPALLCGFRFESEALVDRMAAEVESERGALPLLAFTAARLWEQRDRARGMLTVEAFDRLGGVAGALAQHAEATLERIGPEHQTQVREIFRHLVTAEGTRVSREREELLSAFSDRTSVDQTLTHLIAARLLTSYEVEDIRGPGHRKQRIEVVHESLLSNWPRLVRWQTQDADGAQLHDQLRQAAQLWDGRGRPEDLLWTGTVYREFSLWRETYPGGLTSTEEAFASAMIARAAGRRRQRRIAVTAAFLILLVILGVVGALWQRSRSAERAAAAEARRAESSKLYTLALNAKNPSNALAYVRAALDLSDQREYRRLALRIMSRAPTAFHLPILPQSWNPWALDFSPDAHWLAVSWSQSGTIQLFPLAGGKAILLPAYTAHVNNVAFSTDSHLLLTASKRDTLRIWSVGSWKALRTIVPGGHLNGAFLRGHPSRLITAEMGRGSQLEWWSAPVSDTGRSLMGRTPTRGGLDGDVDVDASGSWAAVPLGHQIVVIGLDHPERTVQTFGPFVEPVAGACISPSGNALAGYGVHGEVRIWSLKPRDLKPVCVARGGDTPIGGRFDQTGRYFALGGVGGSLWDLHSPGSAPLPLDPDRTWTFFAAFHPNGKWLVTTGTMASVIAWPLAVSRPSVLRGTATDENGLMAFARDGRSLVTAETDSIKLWPLDDRGVGQPRTVLSLRDYNWYSVAMDDSGKYVFAKVEDSVAGEGTLATISLRDGGVKTTSWGEGAIATDASGRWVVSAPADVGEAPMRIRDVRTGRTREIKTPRCHLVGFTQDGRLLAITRDTLQSWDMPSGDHRDVIGGLSGQVLLFGDRATLLHVAPDGSITSRRQDGTITEKWPSKADLSDLASTAVGVDEAGERVLVLGRKSGEIEIIYSSGRHSRRLFVHAGRVSMVAVDPRGRWIASWGADGGATLTPFPSAASPEDLSSAAFRAWLGSWSNWVAARSDEQPSGYALGGSALPNWQDPPH